MEPQQTGSSKKLYCIIGGVIVLALLGWFLMRGASDMALERAGVDVDYNGNGSATYTTDDGSVTIGEGKYPDTWPSDAPEYGEGTIQYSGSSNPQTGESGAAVVFTATASVQAMVDFYKRELVADGWTITSTASVGGATVIGATKDTRTFGAYIVDAGNGMVSVTAGVSTK